jgi:transcription elongation factor Elf1
VPNPDEKPNGAATAVLPGLPKPTPDQWEVTRVLRNDVAPCPFCGTTNISQITFKHPSWAWKYMLACENPGCLALAASQQQKNLDAAIDIWNKRAVADENAPVTALEEVRTEDCFKA